MARGARKSAAQRASAVAERVAQAKRYPLEEGINCSIAESLNVVLHLALQENGKRILNPNDPWAEARESTTGITQMDGGAAVLRLRRRMPPHEENRHSVSRHSALAC